MTLRGVKTRNSSINNNESAKNLKVSLSNFHQEINEDNLLMIKTN